MDCMYMKFCTGAVLMAGALSFLGGCVSGYSLKGIEGGRMPMTVEYDVDPDMSAEAILQPYRRVVDSIMSPVVGHSARTLDAYRPESPLSNLLADIIRQGAAKVSGKQADVGVMNMGGIRSLLNRGDITIASVYEIAPFENALSVVTLKGSDLQDLFSQMASVHGEGISGARLIISKEGELLDAKVGGKAIEPEREYQVATIDYLAEGNDHLEAFKRATAKTEPEDATLRDLFIEYVKRCEAEGKMVDAKTEGRIVER